MWFTLKEALLEEVTPSCKLISHLRGWTTLTYKRDKINKLNANGNCTLVDNVKIHNIKLGNETNKISYGCNCIVWHGKLKVISILHSESRNQQRRDPQQITLYLKKHVNIWQQKKRLLCYLITLLLLIKWQSLKRYNHSTRQWEELIVL